jgi:hypothetical protein
MDGGVRLASPQIDWWWWLDRRWLERAMVVRPRRCAHGSPNFGEARGNAGQRAVGEAMRGSRRVVGRVSR